MCLSDKRDAHAILIDLKRRIGQRQPIAYRPDLGRSIEILERDKQILDRESRIRQLEARLKELESKLKERESVIANLNQAPLPELPETPARKWAREFMDAGLARLMMLEEAYLGRPIK